MTHLNESSHVFLNHLSNEQHQKRSEQQHQHFLNHLCDDEPDNLFDHVPDCFLNQLCDQQLLVNTLTGGYKFLSHLGDERRRK
ncbi:hypothetical protein [Acinetobacter baumannii]|uniref:hypothetical protein n=1 Tax=Acinetobacter baumannii TaxID=470 RepID=UPI00129698FA|nr:hypothetical protein [Acinetobacter baumannii]EHU2137010.1 hypothetical protein [Acinetobacter baumannii]